ncbi:unnamed protein product, partial [Fusarium graminearum]
YRQKCHACQKEMSNSYFRVKADGLFDEAFEGADRSRVKTCCGLLSPEFYMLVAGGWLSEHMREPRNSSECGICSTIVKYA